MRVATFERAPRQPTEPIDLAALGRELDLVGAGIAVHHLDLGAEHVAIKQRENVGIRTRALAAKSGGRDEEIAEGLHGCLAAGDAEAHLVGDATEPAELGAVEFGLVQQRRNALAARERADDRAVFRGDGIKIVGGLEAAGAAHVLRHHVGIAGKMFAEMSRQQPSIRVVAAAYAVADEERNGLALVEILNPGGASGLRRDGGGERGRNNADRKHRDATDRTHGHRAQCLGNSCENFDRKRLRRSALTSTVTGNVPFSFLS